jgi:arylsulfatase A-like enzyme
MRNNILCLLALAFAVSCNQPQQQQETKKEETSSKPNILLIVADDMGYSDIASFGGNIQTPMLDNLAKESQLFSNFHVLPTCSPTRSCMLTGNDNHVAGLGIMEEANYPALKEKNLPGYSGHLNDQVVTIPEVLHDNGYHTYMTGKWHLGEGPGLDPYDRGFEQTFILGTGGGSHMSDKKALAPPQHMDYTRNGKQIELPQDFYSTKNYTDSLIQFIDVNKADNKPFFAFLSYTAVHDPLHAPKDYIDKYKGKFDMGWDSLFTLRLKNLQALGIVPNELNRFAKNPSLPKWDKIDKAHKEELARDMEVYAAMLDYMDMSIGRVFDYLKKEGKYNNTMIIFMSDNGANGQMASFYPGNGDGKYLSTFDNKMENRGLQNSYVEMGPGWAQASTAPFRLFKSFTTEGGIRAPLIIKMPGKNKEAGQWNKSFIHVSDLMPTILQLTNSTYPQQRNGKNIHPLIGKSLMPVLNGDSATVHSNDGMGYELFEMKAYIKGNWKILRLPQPFGSGQWQLYDIEKDPAETTDLSEKFPDVKAELLRAWNNYAKENEVYDHNGHYDSIYRKSVVAKDND